MKKPTLIYSEFDYTNAKPIFDSIIKILSPRFNCVCINNDSDKVIKADIMLQVSNYAGHRSAAVVAMMNRLPIVTTNEDLLDLTSKRSFGIILSKDASVYDFVYAIHQVEWNKALYY